MGNTVSCISTPDKENHWSTPPQYKVVISQDQKKETKSIKGVPKRLLLGPQEFTPNDYKVPPNIRRPRRPKTIGTVLNSALNTKTLPKNDIVKRETTKIIYKIPERKTRKSEDKAKAVHVADANQSSKQVNLQRRKYVSVNPYTAHNSSNCLNNTSAKNVSTSVINRQKNRKTVTTNLFERQSTSKNQTKEDQMGSKIPLSKSRDSRIVHVSRNDNLQDRQQLKSQTDVEKSVLKCNRSKNTSEECKLSESVQSDNVSHNQNHTTKIKENNKQTKCLEAPNDIQSTFNVIIKKSNILAEKVKIFDKLDDNNDYYYIEENLKQLIDQLDEMYDLIKNSQLLRARRKAIYKYIFELFEELDEKVEENKVKLMFSSMRNEVSKIEEFENLSEQEKKEKKTFLEKMIAQLDKIYDQIKDNKELVNEKQLLYTRISNSLNKFRKNESKTVIDGRIKITNQPSKGKLDDKMVDSMQNQDIASSEIQISEPKPSNNVPSQPKNNHHSQLEIVGMVEETFKAIMVKSNCLAVHVKSFEKLDNCNDYYFIEENLKQLINQLDEMYELVKDSSVLRARRKSIYKFIYGLFEELDEKVEVNKVKLIFSSMRNEASKLEEELFNNFSDQEKKQNEKRLEEMITQLNKIFDKIKDNKELMNEIEVLYFRLCNLLNKLQTNEIKIVMNNGIKVTNPLEGEVSEKHTEHVTEVKAEHSTSRNSDKEVERNFNLIIEKSNLLAVHVKSFEKLDNCNDYYFVEENLKRLIDQLDEMYDLVKDSSVLRARRKTIYRYLFELLEELDTKVELNKTRSSRISSSMQSDARKLEETLRLFDRLNEKEKHHNKKSAEELLTQQKS